MKESIGLTIWRLDREGDLQAVALLKKMQSKIEELEKDATRYYISRMPVAFMHYSPKKPELVRLDFYPIAKKQEINSGWVSVPLYVDEAMKG